MLTVLGWLILGSISAYFAKRQGRSVWKWFFIGAFLGIFGVAFLFFLPKRKKKKETVLEVKPEPVIQPEKFWYYLDADNKNCGPMSRKALEEALKTGKISQETYVWNEDLADWVLYKEITSSTSPRLGSNPSEPSLENRDVKA